MAHRQPYTPRRHQRRGFSLVELVVVVTIIGILAAIAVPRVGSAASSATSNALQATLANVRKAIDEYYAEHDSYPGYVPGTGAPDGDRFVSQLLQYSDFNGNTNATFTHPYIYGPYLRAPFPSNPINNASTVAVKATPSSPDPASSFGWVAVLSHGYFGINASDTELEDIGVTTTELKDSVKGRGALSN